MAAIKKKRSTLSRVPAEEALFEYAKSLRRHSRGRLGVLVNLSRLTRYSREARYVRSAIEAFDPLMSRFPGQLFALKNDDIVCVVDGAGFADIDEVILRIRYLFRDDENLKQAERYDDEDLLCRWFDIGGAFEDFLEFTQARFEGRIEVTQDNLSQDENSEADRHDGTLLQDPTGYNPARTLDAVDQDAAQREMRRTATGERVVSPADVFYHPIPRPAARPRSKRPLQPLDLAKVEAAIETMDVDALVHRQNICIIGKENDIRPIIVEHFIPIRELEKRLLPETDIASNPWLIQHLRSVLDFRLLRAGGVIQAKPSIAVALRCTIETFFAPEFEEFCASAEIAKRQGVVLEISAFDVMANARDFMLARPGVEERGFRICIGDMEPLAFMMVDRDKLGVDFEKIRYQPAFEERTKAKDHAAIRRMIRQAGPHRVILCACDSDDAIEFGKAVGIKLFQGRMVEKMLKDRPIAASA